jgi:FlaG/FlaF family flagellin (archaellin)
VTDASAVDVVNYNAGLTSCDFINITSSSASSSIYALSINGNGINQEQIVFQAQGIYGNINIGPWIYSDEDDSNRFDVSFPNLKSFQGLLTFDASTWDTANSVLSMPELECWTSISGNPSDRLLDIYSTSHVPKLQIGKASSPFTMTGSMIFEQQAVDVSEVNVLSVGGDIEYAQSFYGQARSMASPSPQYSLLQQIGGTFKVSQLDDGFNYSFPEVKSVGSLEFAQTSFETVSFPKLTTFKPADSDTVSLTLKQSYGTMQLGSYSPYISAFGTNTYCDCNNDPSASVFLNCNDMCSGTDHQTFACPLVEVPDSATKITFTGGDNNNDDTKNDDTKNDDNSVITNYHKKGNSSAGATIAVIATFLLVAISVTLAGFFYSRQNNTAKGGGAVNVNIATKAPTAPVANPMQASPAIAANEKV